MHTFAQRLKELRRYQCYETGEQEPGIKNLVAWADYFKVSIDHLVGRTDVPAMRKK